MIESPGTYRTCWPIGVTPIIEDPTFVGEEMINGVRSNHFTFRIVGLGLTSGAEVTANQGEYWLAVDGQYIVKYDLVAETRTGPDSGILRQEVSIDLSGINQPVNIAFPQGCLNAAN